MSRIRPIKPRVEPPKDRPVQWFYRDGGSVIAQSGRRAPVDVVAWCLPATLTEPSGPVHSLEAEELPPPGRDVLVRVSGSWYVGVRMNDGEWRTKADGYRAVCRVDRPDAWRPIDDEPGDAELLEEAMGVLDTWDAPVGSAAWSTMARVVNAIGPGHQLVKRLNALRAIVEKRSGKDGGK